MGSHGFDRTCWYDRAGLGRSEPRNKKRFDAVDVAGDLHALLHRIGIRPPYILAGGSDGGLFVRVYRALYPREVGGMMLIDASEEHDPHLTLGMDLVPQGGSVLDMRTTLAEVRRAGDLGHLPLVVITAGQNAGDPEWMKSQRRLAALSTDSVHVVAVGAPHGVTDVVPALVTTLARELVTAIRKHSSLPPCSLDLRKLLGRCAR
jgi:pimeloyl-ACP methyl ester carboxylesterase